MKRMKKVFALLLTMVMVLAMAVPAMAQTVTKTNGSASITISNASKGVTYKVYKLFDATVTGTEDGSIAYTGTIPTSLATYFTKDSAGNISATEAATADALSGALKAWTGETGVTATVEAEADGTKLIFEGLAYGYYVVTTTQGEAAVTVTSTNPNAEIFDKNSTPPVNDLSKDADNKDVNIGSTVTYTVKFKTANYTGADEGAKQITKYVIEDTLPDFLSNVTVTSITVGGAPITTQQFADKKITINWTDDKGNSLYKNGAELVITYTATVTDIATIAGAGNKNTVTVTPYYGTTPDTPSERTEENTIYTYAIALKKTDNEGKELAGATFKFPFYVKATPAADGAYIYAGMTAGEGLVNEITTPASGEIVVKGVASGTYTITETKAPNGYNKLTDSFDVTAEQLTAVKTEKTFYIDANGAETETKTDITVTYTNTNFAASAALVVNKSGAALPSTGGMGTTIFYVMGAILVLGAGVLLVTRRRMSAK